MQNIKICRHASADHDGFWTIEMQQVGDADAEELGLFRDEGQGQWVALCGCCKHRPAIDRQISFRQQAIVVQGGAFRSSSRECRA